MGVNHRLTKKQRAERDRMVCRLHVRFNYNPNKIEKATGISSACARYILIRDGVYVPDTTYKYKVPRQHKRVLAAYNEPDVALRKQRQIANAAFLRLLREHHSDRVPDSVHGF